MIDSVSEGADLKRSRRHRQDHGSVQRLPPHSPEAEQGILGCVLLSPNESMALCVCTLRAGKLCFYDLRHQSIYDTLEMMFDQAEEIDLITLQQRLKDRKLLEQVGGLAYISTLPDAVPSAANLTYYLDIVKEKFLLRTMIEVCTGAVGRVYDYEGEPELLLDQVERDILNIRSANGALLTQDIKESVKRCISQIETLHERKGLVPGIPTGYTDLDKMIGGLSQNMIILAARPSMGKTSLAMNIAEHVMIDEGLPVGVFSLETHVDALVMRMLASRARVNMRNIRDGFLAERDFPKLTGAAGKIANAKLFIDDASGLSIMELRAKARRMVSQFGVKLLVIDYIQLLIALINGRRPEKRDREVSEISAGIKALSKELKIPILALSQLNREIDRTKRRPTLADLRESGSLEQDADIIAFLAKPPAREEDDDNGYREEDVALPMNLIIGKNKDGPTGDVNLTFLKSYTRFESAAKISDDDAPEQERMVYAD